MATKKKAAGAAGKLKIQYYRSAIGFNENQKRGFEGGQMPLHRRMPKRGFTNAVFKKKYSTINVSDLSKFEKGSKVGPQELVDAGVIRRLASDGLRVLGDGQIDRALTVSA